jgi:DNA-binding CsgD family transcriptional regulator
MAARPLEGEPSLGRRLPPSRRPAFPGCLLSARELQTIKALGRGLTHAQAAEEYGCRTSTVRTLLSFAYRRLGVSTIAQALAVCTRVGWLDAIPEGAEMIEFADRRVTWGQRLYLEAFDQALRAGDDPDEVARTQLLREAALTGVYREAGIHRKRDTEQPWRQVTAHPLERLAQTLQRLGTREERREEGGQVRIGPWSGAGRPASVGEESMFGRGQAPPADPPPSPGCPRVLMCARLVG